MRYAAQRKVFMEWSSNLAYAVGLIASDGCLSKDRRHISLASMDKELVENLKAALRIGNKIYRSGRGGEIIKKYYSINFGDIIFYKFLNRIGLTSAKSKTIRLVAVPNKFFADFLRGLFDGDGSFYSFWDRRWPKSFGFKLSIASASAYFINWLKRKLTTLYGVKGYLHQGAGVLNLEYVKGDTRKLLQVMYLRDNILFLKRKYDKIKTVLRYDAELHPDREHDAAVAQW